jgi:hypothetical protein
VLDKLAWGECAVRITRMQMQIRKRLWMHGGTH